MASIDSILVPVDFSEDASLALEYAREIAHRFGAKIVLLHVDEMIGTIPGRPTAEQHRSAAQQKLDALVKDLKARDLEVRAVLFGGGLPVRGVAADIVTVAGSEKAGLIVMGTHGRTGVSHLLLGSAAEHVVRHAPCPVLTVRHPDRPVPASA